MDVARITGRMVAGGTWPSFLCEKASATSGRAIAVLVDRLETFQTAPTRMFLTITTFGTKELVGTTFMLACPAPLETVPIDDGNVAVRVLEAHWIPTSHTSRCPAWSDHIIELGLALRVVLALSGEGQEDCVGASSRMPTSSFCPSCARRRH